MLRKVACLDSHTQPHQASSTAPPGFPWHSPRPPDCWKVIQNLTFFCNFSYSRSPLPWQKGILSFFPKGCFNTQGVMCFNICATPSLLRKYTKNNSHQLQTHLWRGRRHLVRKRLIRAKNEDLIIMGGEEICNQHETKY